MEQLPRLTTSNSAKIWTGQRIFSQGTRQKELNLHLYGQEVYRQPKRHLSTTKKLTTLTFLQTDTPNHELKFQMIPQMLRIVYGQLLLWSALESNNSSTISTNSAKDMSLNHSSAAFLASWISNSPTKSTKHLLWNMKPTTPKNFSITLLSAPTSTEPSPQPASKKHLLFVSHPSPRTILY